MIRQKAVTAFKRKTVTSSLTRPANTTAYTAGDGVSAVTTNAHLTFNRVVDSQISTATIQSAICHTSAYVATGPDLDLFLFHTDVTAVADNAAFVPTDAEMLTLVGIVDFPTGSFVPGNSTAGAGGNQVCHVTGLDIPVNFVGADSDNGRQLFGQLVARNAYVPVSGEVFTVDLVIAED